MTPAHLAAALAACDCPPAESQRLQDEEPDVFAYVIETTKHLEPQDTE